MENFIFCGLIAITQHNIYTLPILPSNSLKKLIKKAHILDD